MTHFTSRPDPDKEKNELVLQAHKMPSILKYRTSSLYAFRCRSQFDESLDLNCLKLAVKLGRKLKPREVGGCS